MASVEFIKERIEGAKKKIVKLESKLDRIKKAEATNWTVNPYYYSEYDLKSTLKELEEAKKTLVKYEGDLEKANDKAASRNVPAITEFLDQWKERMTKYYSAGINDFYESVEEVRRIALSAYSIDSEEYKNARDALKIRVHGKYEERIEVDRRGRKYRVRVKVEDGDLEPFMQYAGYHVKREEAIAKLEKELTAEYNRKYDFIIERTNEIVKVITDASNLHVGEKGDLNGYIVGTNGTAKVQTIGAGGWNIQCFHFRTLIHRV